MGNLFQELKRRKVFRVAAVYVVVSWVLIQVADVVLPTFGAPDWVNQTIIFVFILGFPFALILSWAYEVSPEGVRPDNVTASQTLASSSSDRKLIYATFILVLLVAGFQIADRFLFQQQPGPSISDLQPDATSNSSNRYSINLGETRGSVFHADIAVSPDGTKLVYRVQRPDIESLPELWLRELDQTESRLLATGRIEKPFFSPDGEWIAYIDRENTELYKLSIQTGVSELLASGINGLSGGFWHTDDYIYASDNVDPSGLIRVPADGNPTENVISAGEIQHFLAWPQPLPGNESLLFGIYRANLSSQVGLLNQQTGDIEIIIDNGYHARYVSTGHIVFMRDSALMAVPFDLETYEIVGEQVPVVQGIEGIPENGRAGYTFSADGTLYYVPGVHVPPRQELEAAAGQATRPLVWVDRDGNEEPIPLDRNVDYVPALSPDGQKIAIPRLSGGGRNIWTYDLELNNLNRITFLRSSHTNPVWSPDGSRIAFYSSRDGNGLWWQAANGTGDAERLVSASGIVLRPNAFTPDGTQLVYELDGDLFLLTLGSDEPPEPLLVTEFVEARASISADGRWIAYESNETGEFKIYVRPFPEVEDNKWPISNTAGVWPKWSPEGDALFYRGINPNIVSVWEVKLGITNISTEFLFEAPTELFSGNYVREGERGLESVFDVSNDGSRFLLQNVGEITLSLPESENTTVTVIDNWFEELRRLAPRD